MNKHAYDEGELLGLINKACEQDEKAMPITMPNSIQPGLDHQNSMRFGTRHMENNREEGFLHKSSCAKILL